MSEQELLRSLERATWRVGATTNDADLFALILEAAADVGYDSASLMSPALLQLGRADQPGR